MNRMSIKATVVPTDTGPLYVPAGEAILWSIIAIHRYYSITQSPMVFISNEAESFEITDERIFGEKTLRNTGPIDSWNLPS